MLHSLWEILQAKKKKLGYIYTKFFFEDNRLQLGHCGALTAILHPCSGEFLVSFLYFYSHHLSTRIDHHQHSNHQATSIIFAIIGWQIERVSYDTWCYKTGHKDHSFDMAHQF